MRRIIVDGRMLTAVMGTGMFIGRGIAEGCAAQGVSGIHSVVGGMQMRMVQSLFVVGCSGGWIGEGFGGGFRGSAARWALVMTFSEAA